MSGLDEWLSPARVQKPAYSPAFVFQIVIIVGAGIIGLSCAWRLSQAGVKVTVIDAREAAREASWAGAGMLAPGGEIDSSPEMAAMALRSLSQYPEFLRELQEESGISIDFRACGAVEVAFCEAEYDVLNAKAARQFPLGILSESCTYRDLQGRFYPADAVVDPRDVTAALILACRRRGVNLLENEPVLEVGAGGSFVRTAQRELCGEGVLISAGAWSSELYPALPPGRPVKGHLIGYRLSPGFLKPILRSGHTYLVQRASGFLIAGSTTEHVGFDRSVVAETVNDIQERAERLLPELRDVEPDESWIGFRPRVDADIPLIGQVDGTNIWTAYGHYRNGILLAPETARLIAEGYSSGNPDSFSARQPPSSDITFV